MYVSDKIEIRNARNGKSIFATHPLQKEELIFVFEGKILAEPDSNSLQLGEQRHLHLPGAIHESLNHSCEANAYVDFDQLHLKALRDIHADEEVTLNYMTAEMEMFNCFDCRCGAKNCYRRVRGFRYLTAEQQRQLMPLLSPYLRAQLEARD